LLQTISSEDLNDFCQTLIAIM